MSEKLTLRPHRPTILNHGIYAEHDQACAVAWQSSKAVYNMNEGVFQPSWKAQEQGWRLVHADNWFRRLLLRFF